MKSLPIVSLIFLLNLLACFSVAYSQNNNRMFENSSVKISEIGTNSKHSDFGPAIVQDSLYFTTFNDKLSGKSDQVLRNKEFYDLYKAVVDKEGNTIGERIPLREFITRYNDGPVSWCAKTGELFVTQNYDDQSVTLKPFHNVLNRLRIYIAKKINGRWIQIMDFPYNNKKYSVGHPAITESGDTLVFSSDKPGGYGETDLYYSVRKDGKWAEPVNLGPKINTKEKEEFAFIADGSFNNKYLIFSSKGREGLGGFDLYYTRFPSDYSEIIHFDPPLNSGFDDFAMTIPTGRDYGYLTSNRPGTGSDDIYRFTFKRIPKPEIVQKKSRELYVFDLTSLRPIPGANVVSCDKKSYLTDKLGKIDSIACNQSNCRVTSTALGYSEKSKLLTECQNSGITRDTIWMKIVENEKILLRNIYYDFDKWDILPDAAQELDRLVSLMKENPQMKVELGSHTDDRGTEIYNMKLSQLRAKSAIDYIVSKGIDASRIKGTGYGKSQLIHKGVNGNRVTPEQNRENRRTEVLIPGFLRGEAVRQDKGDYSNGRPNASKDYSSFKEHGSLDEKVAKVGETVATAEGVKVEKLTKEAEVTKAIGPARDEKKAQEANISGAAPAKYFVILGSFQSEKKALSYLQQLKSDGIDAIVIGESEPYRVGIGYPGFRKAKEALDGFRDKYTGWILIK